MKKYVKSVKAGVTLILLAALSFSVYQTVQKEEAKRIAEENEEQWEETNEIPTMLGGGGRLVYADSKEEALFLADEEHYIDDYPFMRFVNDVIWEDENEEYAAMYYHAVESSHLEGEGMAKFKIRNKNGKKQYALVCVMIVEAWKPLIRSSALEMVQNNVKILGFYEQYSIVDGARFFWGSCGTEKIKTLTIDGQSPTAVIEYSVFGESEYFFYYENINSDKPCNEYIVEMEE